MRTSVEFILNGEVRRLQSIDPTLTVLRYLREVEHLIGSKEGCAEGDCGACTGVVAELDGDKIRYAAVNTCIQFVGMLDGKALLTVEYLKRSGKNHPVQQSMIDAHASQCGFCTPGFVMSLFAGYRQGIPPVRNQINDLLAGNLCRCTGYTTIITAAEKVLKDPACDEDWLDRERSLFHQLKAIQGCEGVCLGSGNRRFIIPTSVAELNDALKQYPEAILVAGATDVGLFVTKQHREIAVLIYLGKVDELKAISQEGGGLRLGSAVTYSRARGPLANLYPAFDELIRRIGAVQVRNLGTVGGNIANASPIGDMPPALISLGVTIRLRSRDGVREIPLDNYFIEYGKQDRGPSEFVESILIPAPEAGAEFRVYKISKRFDQDISSVCGAFNFIFAKNTTISSARICFGGMAGTPKRALKTEQFLKGKRWSEDVITQAITILRSEYHPLSDWRASASYRSLVAGNLLRRYFLELDKGENLQLATKEASYAS